MSNIADFQKKKAERNAADILKFMKEHPGCLQADIIAATGLNAATVSRHVNRIRATWRNDQQEQ